MARLVQDHTVRGPVHHQSIHYIHSVVRLHHGKNNRSNGVLPKKDELLRGSCRRRSLPVVIPGICTRVHRCSALLHLVVHYLALLRALPVHYPALLRALPVVLPVTSSQVDSDKR